MIPVYQYYLSGNLSGIEVKGYANQSLEDITHGILIGRVYDGISGKYIITSIRSIRAD